MCVCVCLCTSPVAVMRQSLHLVRPGVDRHRSTTPPDQGGRARFEYVARDAVAFSSHFGAYACAATLCMYWSC